MSTEVRRVRVRAFLPDGRVVAVQACARNARMVAFKGSEWAKLRASESVLLMRLSEPQGSVMALVEVKSEVPDGADLALAEPLLLTAAALADRMARGLVASPECEAVVLAGIDLAPADGALIGRLHRLPTDAEAACWQALLAQPDLGETLVLLAGDDLVDADRRRAVLDRHPQARVRLVDRLQAVDHPGGGLRRPRMAECLFPVLLGSDGADIASVRVGVSPWRGQREQLSPIRGSGRLEVESVLRSIRSAEPASAHAWETVVGFTGKPPSGDSYQLALAVADRMARGREWPGAGRVFATGSVNPDGSVGDVDGNFHATAGPMDNLKLRALSQAVLPGDSLLLPDTPYWRSGVAHHFPGLVPGKVLANQPCIVFCRHLLPQMQTQSA